MYYCLSLSTRQPHAVLYAYRLWTDLHQPVTPSLSFMRTQFEQCLDNKRQVTWFFTHGRMRHCVLIWMLYLQYETSQGQLDKAKSVYFRAIRECPWSKDVYLFGLVFLSHSMEMTEVEQVYSIMEDKDIRLRSSIE